MDATYGMYVAIPAGRGSGQPGKTGDTVCMVKGRAEYKKTPAKQDIFALRVFFDNIILSLYSGDRILFWVFRMISNKNDIFSLCIMNDIIRT